jgi:hypothetical protein
MRIKKFRLPANQFESPVFQLPTPEIGELADQSTLSLNDRTGIEPNVIRLETKLTRPPEHTISVGRFQKGFARHTSSQDAKATEFRAAINDGRSKPGCRRRACASVAGTAATDHNKLEFVHEGFTHIPNERERPGSIRFSFDSIS